MDKRVKKWTLFVVRWGVAVAGIAWVISGMSLHDRVMIQNPATGRPEPVKLVGARPAQDSDLEFAIADQYSKPGQTTVRTVSRYDLYTPSDIKEVIFNEGGSKVKGKVLGLKVSADPDRPGQDDDRTAWPLVVLNKSNDKVQQILPEMVAGRYAVKVPYPIVDIGLIRMVSMAKMWLLALALLIFPVTYIVTSYRWHELLKALDIHISLARAFVLNMVGAFYNSFMPGSTGGDVLKAYYASKQTVHRTRAVMSVVVDRVIGLLALVMMGGAMAAVEYFSNPESNVAHTCLKIAIGSGAIMAGCAVGLYVFYHPMLRRVSGLDWLIRKMPMQKQVQNAVHVMEMYRRRPWLVLWSFLVTFPVHITVAVSALFAGKALHLNLTWGYYFVVIPVMVLVSAIPISPQGAGVMEYFAIKMTEHQGTTVAQAFALSMSVRLVQIFWNLTGGILVLRGGYHAPTADEKSAVEHAREEDDDVDPNAALAPA